MANNIKLIDTNTLLFYHQQLKGLLNNKVDKELGKSLLSDSEITRLASLQNYDDAAIQALITEIQGQIAAIEANQYDDTQLRQDIADTYATIADMNNKVSADDLATAVTNANTYTDTEITKLANKMTSAMHYKGNVETWDDLPTNPETGDFYNILQKSEHNNAGDNAVWNGTEWDVTSGLIDTSDLFGTGDLATNSDIEVILKS